MGQVERNRFNTERAIEIYTFAVDHAVWDWVKTSSVAKLMYEPYLRSRLGKRFGVQLAQTFKSKFNPPLEDQRPPRRFLRFLLGS